MEKVYSMKGIERIPILGVKPHSKRLKDLMNDETISKIEKDEIGEKLSNFVGYHLITGTSSIILIGIGIYEGIRYLLE